MPQIVDPQRWGSEGRFSCRRVEHPTLPVRDAQRTANGALGHRNKEVGRGGARHPPPASVSLRAGRSGLRWILVDSVTTPFETGGVKRLVPAAILFGLVYTALGLITRSQEEGGGRRCMCLPDCWCQRPLLGIYR